MCSLSLWNLLLLTHKKTVGRKSLDSQNLYVQLPSSDSAIFRRQNRNHSPQVHRPQQRRSRTIAMSQISLEENTVARGAWVEQMTAAVQQKRNKFCDIIFIVQGTKFHASKFLFALHRCFSPPTSLPPPTLVHITQPQKKHSSVFAETLFEKTSPKEYILDDISLGSFQIMCNYFYGLFDKAILTKDNIVDVLHASQIYKVRLYPFPSPSLGGDIKTHP